MSEEAGIKIIVTHRRALHEYFIEARYEAGIVLTGTEVKSLREGKINLSDSYAVIRSGEVWLVNVHINEYKFGNVSNHDPLRERKLLLNKSEIRKLKAKVEQQGYTLVALKFYFSKGKVKVELGLAKGKKLYDKRESIAKRDLAREQERKIKL